MAPISKSTRTTRVPGVTMRGLGRRGPDPITGLVPPPALTSGADDVLAPLDLAGKLAATALVLGAVQLALPGVSLFYLARLMGTSVDQIDRVYGHLLPDSEEYLRGLLDTLDSTKLTALREKGEH